MNILGLCGSLRAASFNTALLHAASRLMPAQTRLQIYTGLGDLPLFNPDLEPTAPGSVIRFRDAVAQADALLIASPEYAHGITGVMKNALDWLVSDERFAFKPVAVLNASPRAQHADAALREVLRTMSARLIEPASLTVPVLGSGLDAEGMVHSPEISQRLSEALRQLLDAVRA
ncbi:NAD(P)H-dependent FMN reductase [Solimonas aquatica]|uniref:NAD(P)H-dependent FMN reductase n=1 Tax=Solimonas aquatica TaxID=489703 RepID=A0A1H9CYJ4_9GAMM|nr:NADPH-dependent FMN reductase [Solimonas aquatica]SEQ06197.1 NAD(P)H-dependent FMN reductase [Solimonas aquatica]